MSESSANQTPEPLEPITVEWTLVETPGALAAAIDDLASGTGPFAIDTERASGFTYKNDAYLLQITREGAGIYLIDPLAVDDLQGLRALLMSDEWILHAASQDLPCLRMLDLEPPSLFDTELAARLLNHERVGLGPLAEHVLGIHLAKAHSAADWSTRPLPPEWLEYAALDVAFLAQLRSALRAELQDANRLEWAEAEFAWEIARPEKPAPVEPWRRLSGGHTLRTGRQRAIAKSLWEARDEFARDQNIAPGRLIPDASIVAVALAAPESMKALAKLHSFRGRASRRELPRWWEALRNGRTTRELPEARRRDPDALPNHRGWAKRHPEAATRLAAARSALQAYATEIDIPLEQLVTPEAVRRLAWEPPTPTTEATVRERLSELDVRPWQVGITAPILTKALVDNP